MYRKLIAAAAIKGASYGFAKSVVRQQDEDWHIVMARPK